ncbi:MAG: TetR/AcrR family transcriptional regulator [Anaerolineae bacterium]|nr:TetR/AcrR family transcriptional regulator [Anaerolineae bacterium]
MATSKRQITAEEIKSIARQQMAEKGTNGLSLRGIARELNITAPAIYNYFPRLDDLITALIVDAFTALACAVEAADQSEEPSAYGTRLKAAMMAYREWAVMHPADFQLIYGNPIPGYEAPAEVTIPLARRSLEIMGQPLGLAWQAGQLSFPPEYQPIPPENAAYMKEWLEPLYGEIGLPVEMFYLLIVGWSRIHGIIMLELFEHIGPTVGDVKAFYEREVDTLLERCGLQTDTG